MAEHQEDILFMALFLANFSLFMCTTPNPYEYTLSPSEISRATFSVVFQVLVSTIAATPFSILAFLCASRPRFQEDIGNETRFKLFISDQIFSLQVCHYIQLILIGVDHVLRLLCRVKVAVTTSRFSVFPYSDNSYKIINTL
ncbi:hypothetical protein GYMLUDRAFT_46208 [Collybiopsis luxurians FD-317 M1]|uniref:Uncharacterized protein n=1 Tax=Collybiopsis luxurians FD-317 M1 TaxID=944289 RepID=A0A0D0C4H1_9AGAR|nr:hypothetical protein GYMLUDRAFT_46208 [Collybiopsis luxurians FD-317 M1]